MKKRFLFRKCLLAVGLLTAINPLSSCSMFFGGDEFTITDTDVKTDENGNTIVTVTFSGENVEPLTFTIPATTKGIQSVTATNQGDQVVLTINYNDGTNQQIGIPVINGQDGVGISSVELIEDVYGDKFIQFTYTNGTKSDKLPLPKGNDGVGVSFAKVTDENGVTTVTMSFTDGRDDLVFTVADGVSIIDFYYDEENSTKEFYKIIITFSDGSTKELELPKPQVSTWLSGTTVPNDSEGNSGDYYLNLITGDVYTKLSESKRSYLFSIKGDSGSVEKETYNVIFNLRDDESTEELKPGSQILVRVQDGECVNIENIPTPKKEGFSFDGRYAGEDESNPNVGKFTNLTTVSCDLSLFARRTSL